MFFIYIQKTAIKLVCCLCPFVQTGSISYDLQKALVNLIEFDTCNDLYSNSLAEDSMICAGYTTGGIDSCQVGKHFHYFEAILSGWKGYIYSEAHLKQNII